MRNLTIPLSEMSRDAAEAWAEIQRGLNAVNAACEKVGLTGIGLIIANLTEDGEVQLFVPRESVSAEEARGYIERVLPKVVEDMREIADFKGRKPS